MGAHATQPTSRPPLPSLHRPGVSTTLYSFSLANRLSPAPPRPTPPRTPRRYTLTEGHSTKRMPGAGPSWMPSPPSLPSPPPRPRDPPARQVLPRTVGHSIWRVPLTRASWRPGPAPRRAPRSGGSARPQARSRRGRRRRGAPPPPASDRGVQVIRLLVVVARHGHGQGRSEKLLHHLSNRGGE